MSVFRPGYRGFRKGELSEFPSHAFPGSYPFRFATFQNPLCIFLPCWWDQVARSVRVRLAKKRDRLTSQNK